VGVTSTVRELPSEVLPPPRPTGRRLPWRPAAAVAAGLLQVLALPPHDVWPAALLGVALLAAAVHGRRVRSGALAGLLCGLALFVPLLHWSGSVAGPAAWLALAVLQTAFFVPLGAALALVSRLPAWPLWGAALWVGQEALRDRLPFGGFPWGRLAFGQAGGPLAPLASLGGAPLVTFAVALLGGALALACHVLAGRVPACHVLARRGPRRGLLPTAAVALVLLLGALLVPTPTAGQQVRVALVQGNVPRLGLSAFGQRAAVLRNHVDATHRLAEAVRAGTERRPDLVLWPENASDLDPYTDAAASALIDGAVRDVGVPVLVGAVVDGPGEKISNLGIVWDPVTGPGRTYSKQHPVPFGEYMPYRSLLRRISDKVDLVPRDFARGTGTGVLQVGPARVGDVICFEVAYDGLVRDAVREGGRVLVVQTNNASFGRSGQSAQQLAMGRLRAVEHGRSVLVAATSGISAVISPDGSVAQRSGIFTADTLTADVPLRDAQTPATRLGALPELLLALLGAAAVAGALVRRRR
jgi:apolipoprotein N-acyltransferase